MQGAGCRVQGAGYTRKVDARLPGKGNSNSHGARPVPSTITMVKRTWTSRLSMKNFLSATSVVCTGKGFRGKGAGFRVQGAG